MRIEGRVEAEVSSLRYRPRLGRGGRSLEVGVEIGSTDEQPRSDPHAAKLAIVDERVHGTPSHVQELRDLQHI